MKSMSLRCAVLIAVLSLLASCGGGGNGGGTPGTTIQRITSSGGRVAWYKGTASTHSKIAFDAIVSTATQSTEVYIMDPDGSNVTCVTCSDTIIPKGFIGQPEWHPDGQHLVIQAENANSMHTRYNHLAWGINQDLWIIKIDGTGAEKIFDNSSLVNWAALHPHFDAGGSKLIFSQRVATGVTITALVGTTPGGENPWAGWQIHLADYYSAGTGTGKLSNHTILYGTGTAASRGFFETHGFFNNKILFSATTGSQVGYAYVDDVYSANLDGTGMVNLTNSTSTWEEHGTYSPSGNSFVFISSRVNPAWQAPADNAGNLRTELYIQNLQKGGTIQQLTSFNANGDPNKRYLTSDYDWDRTGQRIVVQVAPVDNLSGAADPPEIWMITFPEPQ